METKTRWQDWVNLVFGIWLFISPFILGFSGMTVVTWNAYIMGAAVVIFSLTALYRPQIWEEWINLVIGLWLIAAPIVLGATDHTGALWNYMVLGVLIGGDALWVMLQKHPRHEAASH